MAKLHAPARPLNARLTPRARRRAIAAILEARFTLGAFEATRRKHPAYWDSPRNDMARGIYGEALREKERLQGAPDYQLLAESVAIRFNVAG